MVKRTYFSLAIDVDAKNILDSLCDKHSLSQSEVMEVLLRAIETLDAALVESLMKARHSCKMDERKIRHEKKASVRKAMSKLSPEELLSLEKLMVENGLSKND